MSSMKTKLIKGISALFLVAGAKEAKAQGSVNVGLGVQYNIEAAPSRYYAKPLQTEVSVNGRNLLGTQFLGFDLSATVPLSGNFSQMDKIPHIADGGEVKLKAGAAVFVGLDAQTQGSDRHVGLGFSGGFDFYKTQASPQIKIAPMIKGQAEIGLTNFLDLYVAGKVSFLDTRINPYATSNGIQIGGSSLNKSLQLTAGLRMNLFKATSDMNYKCGRPIL